MQFSEQRGILSMPLFPITYVTGRFHCALQQNIRELEFLIIRWRRRNILAGREASPQLETPPSGREASPQLENSAPAGKVLPSLKLSPQLGSFSPA